MAGVCDLLSSDGMRLLPDTLTLAELLGAPAAPAPAASSQQRPAPAPAPPLTSRVTPASENGAIAPDAESGRVRIVVSFGGPIFVHVPKTGGTTMIAALRQQSW